MYMIYFPTQHIPFVEPKYLQMGQSGHVQSLISEWGDLTLSKA